VAVGGIGSTATQVLIMDYTIPRFVGLEYVRLGHMQDYRGDGLNDYYRAVESLPVCRACWTGYLFVDTT
jgi:hypothetical protein